MSAHPCRGALCVAALSLVATPVLAHAVLERREAQAGSFYRAVVQITHGCGASPTRSVSVTVPDGAIGARPLAKPGWTIATRRGAYGRTYPFVHGSIAEGVKEITWTGGSLPADQFDEFTFSVMLSDDFKPGDTVRFPVDQICDTGAYHWNQVPTAGQDAHALAEPAPAVLVTAATGGGMAAMAAPPAITVGDLRIETPWMRATPGGARVAGGYVRITNTGSVADRLVGASAPIAGHGEVHEMSMDGGVMKMRPVEGGLAIEPGATVELKPGGFHLMFMDLREPAKEGESVRGTLSFARAGTVEVAFTVGGLGAQGPASGHQH